MFVPSRFRTRLRWRWWSVIALLCVAGCGSRNTYQVELRLTDGGFVRTVEVSTHPHPSPTTEGGTALPISEEERKVFTAIYGQGKLGSESERFERSFSSETPDDIGGNGSLIRLTSELGDTFVYHERFRGKLPSLQDRKLREAAVNRVVGWTNDWLDEELAGALGAEEIKHFVANEWRNDLQDLVCLLEIAAGMSSEQTSADQERPLLLVAHFLVERGYLTFTDLAALPLNELSESEQQNWILERLRRKLTSSTGLSADAEALQRLREPEEIGRRFLEFLGRTPEYRLWRDSQLAANAAATVEPSAFLGHALEPVTGPLFFSLLTWGGFDELKLVLHTAAEPLETNGQWDATSGSVRWHWKLPRRSAQSGEAGWIERGLPQVALARWVQVDQPRQLALFGRVLVGDATLRDYCLWRQRLSESQADRWQTLLGRLPELAAAERIAVLIEFKQQWADEFDTSPSILDTLINGLAGSNEN